MQDHIGIQVAQELNSLSEMIARVAGMQAENDLRRHRGEVPAYVETHFTDLVDQLGCGHNTRCMMGRD